MGLNLKDSFYTIHIYSDKVHFDIFVPSQNPSFYLTGCSPTLALPTPDIVFPILSSGPAQSFSMLAHQTLTSPGSTLFDESPANTQNLPPPHFYTQYSLHKRTSQLLVLFPEQHTNLLVPYSVALSSPVAMPTTSKARWLLTSYFSSSNYCSFCTCTG